MSLDWDTTTWQKAVTEFNTGAYFECHETLEIWWLKAEEPLKKFLQGIIQIAAGLIKLKARNLKGSKQLLTRGQLKISTSLQEGLLAHCPINGSKLAHFQDKIALIQTELEANATPYKADSAQLPKIDF